jgi:hypothetical protein
MIVVRQFRQQRLIGDGDDGHADAEEGVDRRVVGELKTRALDRRNDPDQPERERKRKSADQQKGPAASGFPGGAIRKPAHPDVRNRVDASAHQRDEAGQRKTHPDDFCQIEGKDHGQRDQRDVDGMVPEPVDQLEMEGEAIRLHGGSLHESGDIGVAP